MRVDSSSIFFVGEKRCLASISVRGFMADDVGASRLNSAADSSPNCTFRSLVKEFSNGVRKPWAILLERGGKVGVELGIPCGSREQGKLVRRRILVEDKHDFVGARWADQHFICSCGNGFVEP
mmetsp:Transcript_1487/g.2190  ORF Transcript_1487/g.2190 Transcript_1487/m.2190 type:complete len:123 (+) Transcript_1487:1375-1743(+)